MNCEQCRALLERHLEGGLDQEARASLDAHLKACPACRFASQVLQDARQMDEGSEVPASFSSAWRERITQEEEPPVKQFPRITKWLAVAAALVVMVGGTWLVSQNRQDPGYNRSRTASSPSMDGMGYDSQPEALANYAAPQDMDTASSRSGEAEIEKQAAKIIRTVRMELSTRAFDEDVAAVLQALDQAGGWVESASLSNAYSNLRVAYYTLRVPSSQLDQMITTLRGVGRLVSFNESSEDVSEHYADTQNRLRTQQTKMERLQALLAKAETVEDLITVEYSISDTQYEIDRLTGLLRGMDSKVDYSTLRLTLNELSPIETSQDKQETLWDRVQNGVQAAFEGFVQLLADLVVFLSIALPYLLVLVLVIFIIRRVIKRRKNK